MVYLLKMVIFHGYVTHNQMVELRRVHRTLSTYDFQGIQQQNHPMWWLSGVKRDQEGKEWCKIGKGYDNKPGGNNGDTP